MKPTPKYKMAILIWIAIYPTINLLFWILGDSLNSLPMYARTFVLTIILVPLMVFVLLPLLTKMFAKWLSK
jgi:antibiotic biosynthesis monooxygenase (ABM) superfamily enzyme